MLTQVRVRGSIDSALSRFQVWTAVEWQRAMVCEDLKTLRDCNAKSRRL